MDMKELNKIEDITTLKTDKFGLVEILSSRDVILDMVKTGFINREKMIDDLANWMDACTISEYLNEDKEFNFEFQL